MWSLNVILPRGHRLTITSHGVLLVAMGLAVVMVFGLYVALLQNAVTRGDAMRAQWRRAAAAQASERLAHTQPPRVVHEAALAPELAQEPR